METDDSLIRRDHDARPTGRAEIARIWRHSALQGAELFQGTYRNYEFAHHFHAVPAVGVVEKGSMSCYCRSSTHVLPFGTILLLNPGEVHAPGPADSGGWSFRVFFFEDETFSARSKDIARKVLRFSEPFVEDRCLSRQLLRLHRKLETHAGALDLESSILGVFEQLARKCARVSAQNDRSCIEKSKIKAVKDYVHAYYGQDITLEDLAAVAQFSPYHLLRSFRSSIGITPHAYLIQVRVEEGKRLLKAGNSISDVSITVGFTDQSHFTRHFKRIMGVTPGQYRPQLSVG